MEKTKSTIELLSPAGNYECFLAAVNNGADAVYLAGCKFGARAFANNFSEEEIIKALDLAHIFNKKIYLTVNTLLKEDELEELYDYLMPFYKKGLDGVIVQDLGVVSFIKSSFPDMEIHASTQMSISNSNSVNLLKNMGICRVVPARELSLIEIKNIINDTGIEVECFIHGAMCYSYSGKCLLSSFIGGRSGNRGRCAQPCRLEYNNCYPLSMKDMCTIDILPELIEAGIISFKIEGRMKSPEYVACVTGIYRKYIDLYFENPSAYKVKAEDKNVLLDLYSRGGNCNGYYNQYNGKNMITITSPSYKANNDYNEITSLYMRKSSPKISVDGYGSFKLNEKASLTLIYNDFCVTETLDIIELSLNKPTTEENIIKQLSKTGESFFEYNLLNIEADNNIFIPVSKINELRRNAFDSLLKLILSSYERSLINTACNINDNCIINDTCNNDDNYINSDKNCSINRNDNSENNKFCTVICAEAISINSLIVLLKNKSVNQLIVPSFLLGLGNKNTHESKSDIEALIKEINKSNCEIFIKLPYVLRNISAEYINRLIYYIDLFNAKGLIVCNLEGLALAKNIERSISIISDIHMYCFNSLAHKELTNLGIDYTSVPVELNKSELLYRAVTNEYLLAYGKIPLMISSQCICKTLGKCKNESGLFYLKDRKYSVFPIFHNCSECNNVLYNCVPNYIAYDNPIISKLNPYALRLLFTDESAEEINKIIRYYCNGEYFEIDKYTKGHLNRGVD